MFQLVSASPRINSSCKPRRRYLSLCHCVLPVLHLNPNWMGRDVFRGIMTFVSRCIASTRLGLEFFSSSFFYGHVGEHGLVASAAYKNRLPAGSFSGVQRSWCGTYSSHLFRLGSRLVESAADVIKTTGGFGTGDQIDWNDILTVLAVNEAGVALHMSYHVFISHVMQSCKGTRCEAGRPARHEPSPEHLLGRGTSNLEAWKGSTLRNLSKSSSFGREDLAQVSHGEDAAYRCILEDKGLTMEAGSSRKACVKYV